MQRNEFLTEEEGPVSLFSYDATDGFSYNIPKAKALVDWKRYGQANPDNPAESKPSDAKIYIETTNAKGEKEIQSVFQIIQGLDEKQREKYDIAKLSPDRKYPTFTDEKGLRNFFKDFIFHKVPDEDKKEALLNKAMEGNHFGQAGLAQEPINSITVNGGVISKGKTPIIRQFQPTSNIVTYYPTTQGFEVTGKASITIARAEVKEESGRVYKSARRLTTIQAEEPSRASSRTLGAKGIVGDNCISLDYKIAMTTENMHELTKVKPLELNVKVINRTMKDFVYGVGYIRNLVREYEKDAKNYHQDVKDQNQRKQLDNIMQQITALYRQGGQNAKMISLVYIYDAFKKVDLTEDASIEKCLAVIKKNQPIVEQWHSSGRHSIWGERKAKIKASVYSHFDPSYRAMSASGDKVFNLVKFLEETQQKNKNSPTPVKTRF